jgi:hypothetical protein
MASLGVVSRYRKDSILKKGNKMSRAALIPPLVLVVSSLVFLFVVSAFLRVVFPLLRLSLLLGVVVSGPLVFLLVFVVSGPLLFLLVFVVSGLLFLLVVVVLRCPPS